MIHTIEAIIDENGCVRPLEVIPKGASRRALVTILDEPPFGSSECAELSEAALAEDWLRPEEEAAWSHLQPARSS